MRSDHDIQHRDHQSARTLPQHRVLVQDPQEPHAKEDHESRGQSRIPRSNKDRGPRAGAKYSDNGSAGDSGVRYGCLVDLPEGVVQEICETNK